MAGCKRKQISNRSFYLKKQDSGSFHDSVMKVILFLKCKANKLDLDIKSLSSVEREDAMDILSNFNGGTLRGTSFSTPIRVAKLALNDMMNGIL